MEKTSDNIAFGSPEFWELYDQLLCSEKRIREFMENPKDSLAAQLYAITYSAHLAKKIHSLTRPERGWKYHNGWLSLKTAPIQRFDGELGIVMRAGDVIIVEHRWDRDVIITHCPIPRNIVRGYLLGGKWEPMIGLFLPLFDKKTIQMCVKVRMEKNVEEAMKLSEEEGELWRWY